MVFIAAPHLFQNTNYKTKTMKTKYLIATLLLACMTASFAQVGIGTLTPNSSSVLDVDVTALSTKKGLLPPRMTQIQRNAIASPAEGLAVYNTDTKCLEFFDGTCWQCHTDFPKNGSTANKAAISCMAIKDKYPQLPSGSYWLDLDGCGPLTAVQTYCNMTTGADGITKPINYRLGGSGDDVANSIKRTADGGYITVGSTTSSASGDMTGVSKGWTDVWVVKAKADGTIEWQKNYGGGGYDYGYDIQQTAEGGYIVSGSTSSAGSGDVTGAVKGESDVWVLKLDALGNITWQKNYGGRYSEYGYSIQQTTDGGYIVLGDTRSSASGDVTGTLRGTYDMWILKLDASGNITWNKTYGSNSEDFAYSIQQTADGGYIFAGSILTPGTGDSAGPAKGGPDVWVVKLNTSGNIVWEKNYGGSGHNAAYSIRQTTDGGYIVVGGTSSSASGDVTGTSKGGLDLWVLKLTASGSITWQNNYGGSSYDSGYDIQQTTDGGYIVGGYTYSSASGDVTGTSKGGNDYWILKLTASGSITWQKNYGGASNDYLESIQQTVDGKYIVAGYSAHASAGTGNQTGVVSRGGDDIWIITLDENGNIMP